MAELVNYDRRTFLRRGAMGAGALWMVSLDELLSRRAVESPRVQGPYGPVSPKLDETTGLPLLQLPDGFRYRSFAWTGDLIADGLRCPASHDGMAVVDRGDEAGHVILVRNHEIGVGTPFVADAPFKASDASGGGTTNLLFDTTTGTWKRAWASLTGTRRNCAGGVTPWGSWITCEETTDPDLGWCFDVGKEQGDPTPLKDMGRFSHEAIMVDPRSGFVYETEDAGVTSGFYRFVPNEKGKLKEGGELFMLGVKGQPDINLGLAYPLGTIWPVTWVRVPDPHATTTPLFVQGRGAGAAQFHRLEGAWWGDRKGYFLSTSGGQVAEGQVFEYDPDNETLKLIYDSPAAIECNNPDNMSVTPRGGLVLCEDGNAVAEGDRLVGLTLEGQSFIFAINNVNLTTAYNDLVPVRDYRQSELCGVCYSPDGRWLFVNIQSPGITVAITGPWGKGPL
jgi:secreted PhoX family phosphatase